MDYEKAYKQVLERASIAYKDEDKHLKATLERIFPELKESEDEKIRKALLRFHKSTIDIDGIKGYQIQDWLEKQGKKETDEWKEGNIIRHGGILALVLKGRRAMKQNGEQITIQYPDEWVKAEPKEREHFFEELEMKGEQPVPSREMILNVWELGNYWKDITRGVCNTEHGTQLDYILKHWCEGGYCANTIEKQDRQKQWKPSEEQMCAFKQVYDWYNNNFTPSETLTSFYNDLKKLKEE